MAAVAHARSVGQESLGHLTIHQRALRLKHLAAYLHERREELSELSDRTGSTWRDHLIDFDGGIGTIRTFSSKGRKELPNANVSLDGAVEQLSRDGPFLGEHIYTRLTGVAVQINALNFPVWGMLEKLAPSFIAGVPTILKPASQTAYVTHACVRLMIYSGLIPTGALPLISGSARDLLGHLDHRDHVAFTGSADTAQLLRSHDNVAHQGVRFTAETDSLNAAILGPEAGSDTVEFYAFIKSVTLEMTAKTGQKCTAIRRVIVPSDQVDPVVEALRERLDSRVVLVHGGPGRAGGGEELGGIRAVKHYMQRTAVQGSPDLLTGVTGVWHRGAKAVTATPETVAAGTAVHPFRKSLAELRIGDQFASNLRTVALEDITAFAESTGDTFYAHTDEEAATANPFFPRRVAHGYLLVAWAGDCLWSPPRGRCWPTR